MNIFHIAILASVACASPAHSASFDCTKAKTTQEKLICADPALSKLDDELSQAFVKANARLGDKNVARSLQREWLRSLGVRVCKDVHCMRSLWAERISELDMAIASPWNGRYVRYFENKPDTHTADIMLMAFEGGKVGVVGNAISIRNTDSRGEVNTHVGELDGLARLANNKVTYDSDICHVGMTMSGKLLIVQDNAKCGGMGVTFSGEYRKR